jgi:hypothetical protein
MPKFPRDPHNLAANPVLPIRTALLRKYPHASAHLRRNGVVVQDLSIVAEPAGFALNREMPERARGIHDEIVPPFTRLRRHRLTARPGGIEFSQDLQSTFERAAEASERARHFLRDFVVERVNRLVDFGVRGGGARQT